MVNMGVSAFGYADWGRAILIMNWQPARLHGVLLCHSGVPLRVSSSPARSQTPATRVCEQSDLSLLPLMTRRQLTIPHPTNIVVIFTD